MALAALSRFLSQGTPFPSASPSEPSQEPGEPSPVEESADVEAETEVAATPAPAAANTEGDAPAWQQVKRVALPHKVTLVDSMDARALYRLANCLEYQTAQARSLTDVLQKIITGAVEAQERYKQSGGDPQAVEVMRRSTKRMIGILQQFRRGSRPTFESLAQFRDARVTRVNEARRCRAAQQQQQQQQEGASTGAAADEADAEGSQTGGGGMQVRLAARDEMQVLDTGGLPLGPYHGRPPPARPLLGCLVEAQVEVSRGAGAVSCPGGNLQKRAAHAALAARESPGAKG
ncbi:hypothetical protein N2152v2_002496 [Parachlorella kessleri]